MARKEEGRVHIESWKRGFSFIRMMDRRESSRLTTRAFYNINTRVLQQRQLCLCKSPQCKLSPQLGISTPKCFSYVSQPGQKLSFHTVTVPFGETA